MGGSSSRTDIVNRYTTGFQITEAYSTTKLLSVDKISPDFVGGYLRNKGLPAQVAKSFEVLKYVQNGAREQIEFQLQDGYGQVSKIGVAVNRKSSTMM